MARGLKRIAKIAEEGKAKREAYDADGGGNYQRALVLKPGQIATGRFCEEDEDVTYAYIHDLPKKAGQQYADRILCLNQDDDPNVACYACEQDVRRGTRLVMNFIRHDEPKPKRGSDGKVIKDNFNNYQYETTFNQATGLQEIVTEPALVIFATGTGAGGRLAYLESQKGGMTRHIVTIARTSDDTNPYMIDIAEADKVPPAPWEVELFNKKIDPLKAITLLGKRSIPYMSYVDMQKNYSGMSVPSGFQSGSPTAAPPQDNIYAQAAEKAAGHGHINPGAFA